MVSTANIGDGQDTKSLPRTSMDIKDKPVPSWVEWVERNSKPLVRNRRREERTLTIWQKKGPMKKKDWKNFFSWAQKRAVPQERTFKKEKRLDQTGGKAVEKLDWLDLEDKLVELAKPRLVKKKHQFHDDESPYNPAIAWGKPAHRDKGRPFRPPYVPCCFQHDDMEAEFWSQLRFPVRKQALRGHATLRTINLAKPRSLPLIPHCPIPPKTLAPLDVPPPKRKKFTPQGWRFHQIRLIYLSQPINRANYQYFYM